MKAAGISIEGSRLGVSVIERVFGMTKSLKALEFELPDGETEKIEALREILLGLKKEHGIKGVTVGLGFSEFAHHFIELPLKAKKDIAGALEFEIEKHLPLPVDEYAYGFEVVRVGEDGSRSLVLSIRKDRLRWISDCLKDTEIRLLGIRCSFIEAMNEFISSDKSARALKEGAIFLHRSGESFFISGIKGKKPETLRVKAENGLAAEIERLGETYKAGIYATGPSGAFPEGIKLTSLPYSLANIIAVCPFKRSPLSLEFISGRAASTGKDYYPYAAGALAAASVLLFALTNLAAYYKEHSALDKVEDRMEEIRQDSRVLIEERRDIESAEEKIKFLTDFRARSAITVGALRELSAVLPRDAWLTDFSADSSGGIEIKGLAPRAAELIEPLEKSKLFKNVEFSSPVTRKDNFQRFSLKMELEK